MKNVSSGNGFFSNGSVFLMGDVAGRNASSFSVCDLSLKSCNWSGSESEVGVLI